MTPTQRVQAGLPAVSDKFKKAYGQPGGMSSISSQARKAAIDNLQRQKFFDGRKVPEERLRRRIKQDTLERQFKDRFTKDVNIVDSEGNVTGVVKGLTQATADAPRSLAAERERLANILGPTPKEIIGDIGYGLGQIGKAYGIPFVSPIMKGLNAVKSGVEAAWDAVRGEPTSTQGTAFPQPDSDTKDLFSSSIGTGISTIDPDNMLVQIAKANEGRFDDKPTFQEQLANATAMNLNIPSPTEAAQTIADYYTAAAQGVDVDTPLGKVNVNPLAEKIFLDGGIGGINYGGSFDPNTLDYNVGVGTQLPYGVNFSAGTSSNDIPGMSFNKNIGPVNTSFNLSEQGGSLGLNTVVDPLRAIFPGSAIGTPINIGASVDSRGNVNPNVSFMVPFNSGGLGYMFK